MIEFLLSKTVDSVASPQLEVNTYYWVSSHVINTFQLPKSLITHSRSKTLKYLQVQQTPLISAFLISCIFRLCHVCILAWESSTSNNGSVSNSITQLLNYYCTLCKLETAFLKRISLYWMRCFTICSKLVQFSCSCKPLSLSPPLIHSMNGPKSTTPKTHLVLSVNTTMESASGVALATNLTPRSQKKLPTHGRQAICHNNITTA